MAGAGHGAPTIGSYPGANYAYWSSAPSSTGTQGYFGGSTLPGVTGLSGQGANPFPSRFNLGGSTLPSYGAVGADALRSASPSTLFPDDDLSFLPGRNFELARDNAAHIRLRVPADAEVWFDGERTKQTGTERVFTSPPLTPGERFAYEVRVRWTKDGRPTEATKRIRVKANDWLNYDFTKPSKGGSPPSGGSAKEPR
jgi:uncharacterized protein (TIGR03000 family)